MNITASELKAKYRIVTTDGFWELMKNPGFRRIDERSGSVWGVKVYCFSPPDEEFILGKIAETVDSLKAESLWDKFKGLFS